MANHYPNLNSDRALIWRIVHLENLAWILQHGLHCMNSTVRDPHFVTIGNSELIGRRSTRVVPIAPGGCLSDYVPFYFTPFSPMMYNIYTGRGGVPKRLNQDICILVSSVHRIREVGLEFVFTDRHAYTAMAQYYNQIDDLFHIDWPLLQARNFARNADDPEQIERYQAETLVHQSVPVHCLLGVVCYTEAIKVQLDTQIRAQGLQLAVHVMPQWYF